MDAKGAMTKFWAELMDEFSYFYSGVQPRKSRDVERWDALTEPDYLAEIDFEEFFGVPDALPEVFIEPYAYRRTYDVYNIRYNSPIRTPYPENNVVKGKYYWTHGSKRGTIIQVHGWRMERYMFCEQACRRMTRQGFDGIVYDQPFHMRRAPRGTFSGEYTLSGDGERMLIALQQSVTELRMLIRWLRDEGEDRVGIWGVSLGALVCGLVTCLEPDLFCSVLVNPPADPRAMLSGRLGKQILGAGETRRRRLQKFANHLDIASLLAHEPRTPRERIMIVDSVYDKMVPSSVVRGLWRDWGKPRLVAFPQGHLSILVLEEELWPALLRFMEQCERAYDREFGPIPPGEAPKRAGEDSL